MFTIPHAFYWLIIGILFLVLEVIFMSNVGFLFAGCSAFTIFLLLELDIISHLLLQDIFWFFAFTIIWGGVLWWPLKIFGRQTIARKFSHIIGSKAIIHREPLRKGEIGYIKWSGMKIKAKIVKYSEDNVLEANTEVIIVDAKEDIVYVKKQ